MNRRIFALGLAAAFLGAAPALAQGMPGMGSDDRRKMREQMRKRWDDMDHDQRSEAMDRMRGRRSEPRYEEMRERWDKMSPEQRSRMMERHARRHDEMHK
ncbi:MAG: hypothetical protein HY059_18310 [Proteobacteria bacterium]|nr:hypothetical protein [Pseudomonadota bacterium]